MGQNPPTLALPRDEGNAIEGKYELDAAEAARAVVAATVGWWLSIVTGLATGGTLLLVARALRLEQVFPDVVVAASIAGVMPLVIRRASFTRARGALAAASQRSGPTTAMLNLGAVRFLSRQGMSTLMWSTYTCYTVQRGFVLLLRHDGLIQPVPLSAFEGDQLERLVGRRLHRHDGRAFRKQIHLGRTATPSIITNGFALFAPLAAVFLPPLGIILGIVALRAIKKTGQRGRFRAVFGIVYGSIVTLPLAFAIYAIATTGALGAR